MKWPDFGVALLGKIDHHRMMLPNREIPTDSPLLEVAEFEAWPCVDFRKSADHVSAPGILLYSISSSNPYPYITEA